MCCIFNFIGKIVSHTLYFSEKFLYCFTCAALVSCLVTTLFVTLGMGIGIGYNYCFVDFKTRHRHVPTKLYKYHPKKNYYLDPRYPGRYYRDSIENRYYRDKRYPPHYRTPQEPDWRMSTPVAKSGVTDNVNDLRAADNSTPILTRNKNETQSHNHRNNTEQSYNNKIYEKTGNMNENKDQVIQTDKQINTEKPPDDSLNLIVPINELDLIALLSKFRSENKNHSLQIVTT